nr:succinate dehydrogenase assembly factor 2 [Alkalilimnicola ehrlichii]
MLDEQDDQLQDWFLGRGRPQDQELARLVERIVNTPPA